MMGESWEADGPDEGDCVDGYAVTWAREFRYDAARARYLNRELDPEALEEGDLVALSEVWTDYDGDSSYGDFELAGDPLMPSDLRSYEPGVALKDPWDESSGIEYYHADLIGTTRGTTDDLGAPAIGASGSPVTYTAFGERLDSDDYLRYGYAGSWGYQSHDVPNGDPVQFLHVGWRYYDPETGRFLQRDPIGITGGLNAYGYVNNVPSQTVDPTGRITLGGGGTASGHFIFFGLSIDVQFHLGWSPSRGCTWDAFLTGGFHLGPGAYAGAGLVGTATTATSARQLSGAGLEMGVDAPAGSVGAVGGAYGVGLTGGIGPSVGGAGRVVGGTYSCSLRDWDYWLARSVKWGVDATVFIKKCVD
ncbi:MAG: RHS repeat-associated core domain-containing protein [Planctomycetia bacterium]|nr:RHS repeat-associated core domain-containing protein [Planctomycetia bacterium]